MVNVFLGLIKRLKFGLILVALGTVTILFQNCDSGFDAQDDQDIHYAQENPIPEGFTAVEDMILPSDLVDSNPTDKTDVISSGLVSSWTRTWPNGDLIFKFDGSVTSEQRARFKTACRRLSKFAGVRCLHQRYADPNSPYILVQTLPASSTYCGRATIGSAYRGQIFEINQDCWHLPQIVEHELMHSFGISHEHMRPDRDLHVDYFEEDTGYGPGNFDKLNDSDVTSMTKLYDFESIMHYNSWLRGYKILWKKGYRLDDPRGEIKYQNYISLRDHRILYRLYRDSSHAKTAPTGENYNAFRNSYAQELIINCQSAFNQRRVCFEGSNGSTRFEVISINHNCYGSDRMGQNGNTIWLGRGCNAKLKVTTTSHFSNVFQIAGVTKYTADKILKTYADWELEGGR